MAATLYAEPPKAVVPLTPQRAYALALEAQHRGTLPTIKGRCLHFLFKPHSPRTPNIMRLYRALRQVEGYGWPPRTTSQHAGEVAALPVAEMAVAA
jgi:hypothetical protein